MEEKAINERLLAIVLALLYLSIPAYGLVVTRLRQQVMSVKLLVMMPGLLTLPLT